MHVMSIWPRINSAIWRNCGWKMENKDFMTVNWMQDLTTSCPGTPRRLDKRWFIIPMWLSSLLLFIGETNGNFILFYIYILAKITLRWLNVHKSSVCNLIIHCTHKPLCGDKLKLLPCEWISEIYGSKHHLGFMCNKQTRILKYTTG